jgi:hypothetical protein
VDDASSFVDGDKVRLLRLDEEFFVGIDPEDVSRLKRLVGLEWTVSGRSEHGHVEIEFVHASDSPTPLEWVCVPPSWIERVR